MSKENNFANFSDALADAVEKASSSIVLIDGRRRFPASGILYAEDLVLTAEHVLERDAQIGVILANGTEITAEVIGRDPSSDLALLKLAEPMEAAAEPFQGEMRVGELVLALGRPSKKGIVPPATILIPPNTLPCGRKRGIKSVSIVTGIKA